MILGPVKLLPEASDLFEQIPSDDAQMADIVDGTEHIHVHVRLKMRLKKRLSVKIYLILIGIYKLRLRIFRDCLCNLIKRPFRKLVIMVAQSYIISHSSFEPGVGVPRYAAVAGKPQQLEPVILFSVF